MKAWVKLFILITVIPRIALFNRQAEVLLSVKTQGDEFNGYRIHWYDGSSSAQESELAFGSFTRTHIYYQAGSYPITVHFYRNGVLFKTLSTMLVLKGGDEK